MCMSARCARVYRSGKSGAQHTLKTHAVSNDCCMRCAHCFYHERQSICFHFSMTTINDDGDGASSRILLLLFIRYRYEKFLTKNGTKTQNKNNNNKKCAASKRHDAMSVHVHCHRRRYLRPHLVSIVFGGRWMHKNSMCTSHQL